MVVELLSHGLYPSKEELLSVSQMRVVVRL